MTLTEIVQAARRTEPADLNHWVCCLDDNYALCGTDVTDLPWDTFDLASCVVCHDLDSSGTCPRDGRPCPEDGDE